MEDSDSLFYQPEAQILYFNTFIILLYMFRTQLCSSSGGQIVLVQHLVSSLSLGDCSVHRLRESSRNLCTEQFSVRYELTVQNFDGFPSVPSWRLVAGFATRMPTFDPRLSFSRNLCTEQSPKESDDTRCCTNTICPPEDEHNRVRNM